MSLPTCPKCGCQLEVKLTFASGPRTEAVEASATELGELLQEAENQSLNSWEQEFVSKLRERYNQYGDRTKLSDKQRNILEKIASGE